MNLSKKMIACAAIVIALFSVSTTTYAQRGDTAAMRQRQEAMMQKMKDDLKLTPVQYDSVWAINKEFMGKMRDIFMDQSVSQEDRRAKMQPIRAAQNARLQAALGDDMYKKYQDWMAANRPQRGGNR
jgi:hypothetical protein